jgi:hypothetical protein
MRNQHAQLPKLDEGKGVGPAYADFSLGAGALCVISQAITGTLGGNAMV